MDTSAETKWTPGPEVGAKHWFVVQSPTGVHIGLWDDGKIDHEVAASEAPGYTVIELVEVASIPPRSPVEAAAPELYEALAELVAATAVFSTGLFDRDAEDRAVNRQIAAEKSAAEVLAKARGEQP